MSKPHASRYVILFFVALTLVGLLTSADYGLPMDETSERVILQENLKEYAHHLLGDNSEAVRYYDAIGVQRISQSIERDHGQAAYYAAAPLLQLSATAPEWLQTLWHAYTWLWFMLGVISLYRLARALQLSRLLACGASLLLYLCPRFFAEGHYNNKDVVLLALVLWTLAEGALLLQNATWRRALLFSLAGALAANTKVVGLLPWGLIGLATVITLLARRSFTAPRIKAALVAVVSFCVFYTLLTPTLWTDPQSYLPYVLGNATGFSRWTGVVLFNGTVYDPTRGLPLPRLYLPTMVALTIPIGYLLLAAIGQCRAVLLFIRKDSRRPLLLVLTLLWLLPTAYAVLARPLLYNGWRHFYFIYAGIAPLGALGMQTLMDWLGHRRIAKAALLAALGLLFALQGVGIALNHPYQYAYYNSLAENAEQRFELDYWGISTANAMRKLASVAPGSDLLLGSTEEITFLSTTRTLPSLSHPLQSRIAPVAGMDVPYVLANTTYAVIYDVALPSGYVPYLTLTSYGNNIATVYALTGVSNGSVAP